MMLATALGLISCDSSSGFVQLCPSLDLEQKWEVWEQEIARDPILTWNQKLAVTAIEDARNRARIGRLGWVRFKDIPSIEDLNASPNRGLAKPRFFMPPMSVTSLWKRNIEARFSVTQKPVP
jgi:hypothetical protein